MDQRPFFSFIIPMYNVSQHIGMLIALLKKLENITFEAILSDDGSTDATVALCEKAVDADPRFTILRAEHRCSAAAPRNHALRHASGRYVLFFDSDDEPVIAAMRPMADFLKQANYPDILCCRCSTGRRNAEGVYVEYGIIDIFRQADGEISGRKLLERFGDTGSSLPCNVFISAYRREFLVGNGLFQAEDLLLGEDYVWSPGVFLTAERVRAMDVVHYRYIRRDDSLTGSLSERCFADAGRASARLCEYYKKHMNEMSRPLKCFWSRYALNLYIWYFFNPVYQKRIVRKQWIEAWRAAGLFDSLAHWRMNAVLFKYNSRFKKCFIPFLALGMFGIRLPGMLFFKLSEKAR